MKKTVGIAGAGLIGRLAAFTLSQHGWRVTLFDRDTKTGNNSCGRAAAGMLSPYAELESTESLILEMGRHAADFWETLLVQLNKPVFFQRAGSLLIAHPQDLQELSRLASVLNSKLGQDEPIIEYKIQQDAIHAIAPSLPTQRFSQALYFPGDAHLDPADLFPALESSLLAIDDLTWHDSSAVIALAPHKIHCHQDVFTFDWVLDCRGLGARDRFPDLRGVRGEAIRVNAPSVDLSCIIRLIHPRYPLYIAPKADGDYIIGASMIESDDMSPISVQTTLELLSAAYSVHPGFAEARIIDLQVNCRPAFPDNLPRIAAEPGLASINGLHRHGYLIAPTLLEKLMELAEKENDHP